jgi:hypothetical protein
MKKIIALLLTLMIAIGLCACAGGDTNRPASEKTPGGSGNNATAPNGSETDPGGETAAPATEKPQEQVAGSEGLDVTEYDENCVIERIGTFSGEELVIPSHYNGKPVTSIYEDAISNNTMVSLFIPWTVVSIGEDAVSGSEKLEKVTFSEGLISIGEGTFGDCKAIKNVTLPSTLEFSGRSSFSGCSGLEEVVLLGNSSLENYAFYNCDSLKKVSYTNKDGRSYSLKSSVFEDDSALEEIVFSEGLEAIGSFSCFGCTSLKTVYLPKTLKKVDARAFDNIGSLKVFYAGSEEDWNNINFANGNDLLKNADIEYNHK